MRIIIIGAGFSGLNVIKRLRKIKKNTEIILFDRNKFTSMLPSLPDLVSDKIKKKYLIEDIKKLLPKHIKFKNEKITDIDLFQNTIRSERSQYDYDYLVIACGSIANFYGFNKNIEKIYKLDSIIESIRINNDLKKIFKKTREINMVISGAGYTGLELATGLKYFFKKNNKDYPIFLIQKDGDILQFLNKQEKDYIKSYLDKENIKILFNSRVTNFNGKDVIININIKIENSFLIWTTGSKFPINNIKGNFEQISDGRLITNDYLQLPGHLNVFVIGDSAAVKTKKGYIRKAVSYSVDSGISAGKNIIKKIKNKKLKKFIPFDPGWVIPLHNISVGKLFNILPVRGKTGLRLHYFLCGYRNYNFRNFIEYLKKAINLD